MTIAPTPSQPPGATPDDEQRTIVKPRDSGGAALAIGQALQEYVIEGLVGEGGFGIVYLARDTRLDRIVALKEYMPTSLAQRGGDRSVAVRSERHRETFALGLRSFVNEAKLLASFDHPSLVKVYRFWEENGTAYMVMPFYEGPTLRQKLTELGQPPDEAWLRALLAPMIDALELIHNDRCWHRDIAPDNILLLAPKKNQAEQGPQLRPLLLDFGAARRVIGDVTHDLTVILKPGYAPLEQYAESETMRQGPWTDVYALCAVLYCAITGRAPVPSVSRVLDDEMLSAAQAGAGRYSQAFLAAIDAGLAVRPDMRPQSMAALREHFDLGPAQAPQNTAALRGAAPAEAPPVPAGPAQQLAPAAKAADRAVAAASRSSGQAQVGDVDGGAQKWPLIAAGLVLLLVAGAALGLWLQRGTAPLSAPPASTQPALQIAPPAPPAVAPQPTLAATPASAVPAAATTKPPDAGASAADVIAARPALTAPPQAAAPAKTSAPAVSVRATAPLASAVASAVAAPARAVPARLAAPEASPQATPGATPLPAPPALDTKRFECEVLVRAGHKALANRSYDDAMQRADEAQAVFADCPGAAELARTARQAKDRARSSAVIQ